MFTGRPTYTEVLNYLDRHPSVVLRIELVDGSTCLVKRTPQQEWCVASLEEGDCVRWRGQPSPAIISSMLQDSVEIQRRTVDEVGV
jgi:hypothetical protein